MTTNTDVFDDEFDEDEEDFPEFVDPRTLPVVVDEPGSRRAADVNEIEAYGIGWAIRWSDAGINDRREPMFFDGDRLVDYLDLSTLDLDYGDPRTPLDAAVRRIAEAMIVNQDRDYDALDALHVTITPGEHGHVAVRIDVDRLRNLAATSNSLDQADAEILDSLTGDGGVNLVSLSRRITPDVAEAVTEAFLDLVPK